MPLENFFFFCEQLHFSSISFALVWSNEVRFSLMCILWGAFCLLFKQLTAYKSTDLNCFSPFISHENSTSKQTKLNSWNFDRSLTRKNGHERNNKIELWARSLHLAIVVWKRIPIFILCNQKRGSPPLLCRGLKILFTRKLLRGL